MKFIRIFKHNNHCNIIDNKIDKNIYNILHLPDEDRESLHISCILWMSLLPVKMVSDARMRRIPVDFSMSRQAAISAHVMPPITQITTIFGDNAPR